MAERWVYSWVYTLLILEEPRLIEAVLKMSKNISIGQVCTPVTLRSLVDREAVLRMSTDISIGQVCA